jgi:hypothetical protein
LIQSLYEAAPKERVTESIARAFFSVQEGKVIPLQHLEVGKKREKPEGKRRRFKESRPDGGKMY